MDELDEVSVLDRCLVFHVEECFVEFFLNLGPLFLEFNL